MRGVRRFFIILSGGLLAIGLLLGGTWFGLNRYILSPGFATRVKTEAQRYTGVPVNFKDTLWELGRGITLSDFEFHNGDTAPAQGSFKAPQFILKYEWQSLWERKFEITRLTIKSPSVLIGQDTTGSYILPLNWPAPATTSASKPESSSSPIGLALKAFNLERGTVEVKDATGATRLLCSGIDTEGKTTDGEKPGLKGVLYIGEIWLMQKVKLTSVRSPMALEGDTFSLSALEADAYGGHITGTWQQNFSDPKKSYDLKLNLSDCDVNALLTELDQKNGQISGRVDAKTFWLGPATDPMAISGKGTIELRNGQLIQVPFFKTLSQLLGVPALNQPDVTDCKIEFTVADQLITISSLQLKSALFELSGSGTMGFDLNLKMNCRLDLSPEITQQLPGSLDKLLEKRDNGYRSITFKLTGNAENPKVELGVNLADQAIDALKGFFGKKDKKTDKIDASKPADTSVPTTAPATTTSTPVPAAVAPAADTSTNTPVAPASAPAQ